MASRVDASTLSIQIDSHLALLDRHRGRLVEALSDRLAAVTEDVNELSSLAGDEFSPQRSLHRNELSAYASIASVHPKSVLQELRQLDGLIVAAESQREAMDALLATSHHHPHVSHEGSRSSSSAAPKERLDAWHIDASAHAPPREGDLRHEVLLDQVRSRLVANRRQLHNMSNFGDGSLSHQSNLPVDGGGCEFDCDKLQAKLIRSQAVKVLPSLRLRRGAAEEEALRRGIRMTEANSRSLIELMFFMSIPTHRRTKELCKAIFMCENANKTLIEARNRLQREISQLAAEFERTLSAHALERSSIVAHFDTLFVAERRRADDFVANILGLELAGWIRLEGDKRQELASMERDAFLSTVLSFAALPTVTHFLSRSAGPAAEGALSSEAMIATLQSRRLVSAVSSSQLMMTIGADHLALLTSDQITQTGTIPCIPNRTGTAADEYHAFTLTNAMIEVEQCHRRVIILEESAAHGRELHQWHYALFQMRSAAALGVKDVVIASLQRQLAVFQSSAAVSQSAAHWSVASSRSPSASPQSPPQQVQPQRLVPQYYSLGQAHPRAAISVFGIRGRSLSPGGGSVVSDAPSKVVAVDTFSQEGRSRSFFVPHLKLSSTEMVLSMCEGLELVDRDQIELRERSEWRIISDTIDSIAPHRR